MISEDLIFWKLILFNKILCIAHHLHFTLNYKILINGTIKWIKNPSENKVGTKDKGSYVYVLIVQTLEYNQYIQKL